MALDNHIGYWFSLLVGEMVLGICSCYSVMILCVGVCTGVLVHA
jgi:hypothetical protein